MLAARSIVVSHETVRRWAIKIAWVKHWLSHAVD